MFFIRYILLLVLLAIGIFCYFRMEKSLVVKFLCSALVFTYGVSGALGAADNSAFRFLLAGGLLCCVIGDVAIAYSFTSGMAVFAAAHICFIAGFITAGLFSRPAVPLLVFAILIAPVLFAVLKFNFIKMELRTAVCLYAALLSFMASLAVYAPALRGFTCWSVTLALGSVLFLVSDALLAVMTSGRAENIIDYISLPAYYLAISMFAHNINL